MELMQSRLLNLMHSKKLSYQDLADITHINKATLQRYFTGRSKKIPIERIWPIAFALDTTPNYLMGDTDDPSPSYATSSSYTITGKPTIEQAPTFSLLSNNIIQLQERAAKEPLFAELLNTITALDESSVKSTLAFISVLTREA